jgi:hypothetical protein
LRARAGAVDFIRHQELSEDRALDEAESAAAIGGFFHHLRPENVGRHEIGCELHTAFVEPKYAPERFDEPGLGEPRDADQKAMAAGENGHKCAFDHIFLPEHRGPDGIACPTDLIDRRFGCLNDPGFEIFRPCFVRHVRRSVVPRSAHCRARPAKGQAQISQPPHVQGESKAMIGLLAS